MILPSASTRRDWLKASLGSLIACPAIAEPRNPRVAFGFSLYGMKSLPILDAIKACAEIGYNAIEFACMPGWPTDPIQVSTEQRRSIRQALRDRGLSVASVMENLPQPTDPKAHTSHLERLQRAAEFAHSVGDGNSALLETILSGKPGQWEQLKNQIVDRLGDWAKLADKANLTIAIKPHVSNAMQRPEQAVWLVEQLKSQRIRLAFDFSHFQLQSLPLKSCYQTMAPYVSFLHIKDAKGSPTQYEFLLPGQGDVPYEELFGLWKALTPKVPIVVEVSGLISNRPKYDPVAAARQAFEAIAPKMTKAGIR